MTGGAWWAVHRGLLYLLILLTPAVGTYGLTVELRGHDHAAAPPTSGRPAVPAALQQATARPAVPAAATTAPAPRAAAVAAALARPAAAPELGGRLLAHVVDGATGAVLYDRAGATPAAPASTAKLLTAAAILARRPATYRFATTVVQGARAGSVVLVGGGDPTLTGAATGRPGAYPGAARVADLAAQLRGRAITRIVVDGSRFAGPTVSPDWDAYDVPTDYGGAISALMVDGARAQPTDAIRSTTPALDAGRALAARLGRPDIPVVEGAAPPGARTLARVQSAPLAVLIDQMLQESDNVIAEVLARDVAVAAGATTTFRGATAAIAATLRPLGVDVGAGMRDGSGLSSADRVSPVALTALLRLISGAQPSPKAAALRGVLEAMPVGGWSGTLADRYAGNPAAGRARAKTGTLTGVTSLAGIVRDDAGRLLVFSFDADRVVPGGAHAADAALDQLVAALAQCGCR